MVKETGLGITTFSWDDSSGSVKAIKDDFTTFNFDTPRALQDVTGLGKSAMERLQLLSDFTVSGTTVFNDGSPGEHEVFKNIANARTVTVAHSGQSLNNEVFISSAALTRAASGELTRQVTASLSSGIVPSWS